MGKDMYGYTRDVKPNGHILTSEYATLRLDGTKVDLIQGVNGRYAQRVETRHESGSPTLFYLTGQPEGEVTFNRLIGRDGFLAKFGAFRDSCGKLLGLKIGLDGTGACSSVNVSAKQIAFSGGVVTDYNFSWDTGGLQVQEGAAMKVALMSDN